MNSHSPPLCRVVVLSLLQALTVFMSSEAHGQTVFRCPGPPLIYTDEISAEEASRRNCVPLTRDSRWIEIARSESATAFVDSKTINRTKGKVKVWVKWQYPAPIPTSINVDRKTFQSEKRLTIFDCANRASTTIQALRYSDADTAGQIVEETSTLEAAAFFKDVAPETIGESILDFACTPPAPARR